MAIRPDLAEATQAIASVHAAQNRLGEARAAHTRAAKLRPDRRLWTWQDLGLCPAVFADQPEIDDYRAKRIARLDDCLSDRPHAHWEDLLVEGFGQ